VVFQQRDKNLFFSTEVEEAIKRSQIIFLAVNTPTKDFGTWVRLPSPPCSFMVRGTSPYILLHAI
jgi:hypothetical protein